MNLLEYAIATVLISSLACTHTPKKRDPEIVNHPTIGHGRAPASVQDYRQIVSEAGFNVYVADVDRPV